jgi:hypothetical protein
MLIFFLLIGPVFIENGIMRGRDLKSGDILFTQPDLHNSRTRTRISQN